MGAKIIVSIGLLGRKIGMTQIFNQNGLAIPITVIHLGPAIITQIKTKLKDGYDAIQIGYSQINKKNLTKPELGHLKKLNAPPLAYLKEYSVSNYEEFSLGQTITIERFKINQLIDVTGQSSGKGFSGNQKRHKFKRGLMTHGSKNHRAPGSIGAGTTPGRVFPGKKMAGQLGAKNVTISKLKILNINYKEKLLIIKGSIPGKPGNLISVIPSK
jgi:large subunit ribosomal protein L3